MCVRCGQVGGGGHLELMETTGKRDGLKENYYVLLLSLASAWEDYCMLPHQGNHQQQPSCFTGNGRILLGQHKGLVGRVVDEDSCELTCLP